MTASTNALHQFTTLYSGQGRISALMKTMLSSYKKKDKVKNNYVRLIRFGPMMSSFWASVRI